MEHTIFFPSCTIVASFYYWITLLRINQGEILVFKVGLDDK
jgi:hypothetical protein